MPNCIRLVSGQAPEDLVRALEELLADAKRGQLVGLAYAAMYRRHEYVVDTAGECRRNPTFTRGMVRALDDRLALSIGSRTDRDSR